MKPSPFALNVFLWVRWQRAKVKCCWMTFSAFIIQVNILWVAFSFIFPNRCVSCLFDMCSFMDLLDSFDNLLVSCINMQHSCIYLSSHLMLFFWVLREGRLGRGQLELFLVPNVNRMNLQGITFEITNTLKNKYPIWMKWTLFI